MTCLTEDPLGPRAHVAVAGAGVRPAAPGETDAEAGTDSTPSTKAPPAATVSGPPVRRARGGTAVLRRARPEDPASPFISLVAPMGGYLQRHRTRPSPSAGGRPGAAWGMGAKES